jgi:cobalamin biosynthesis Co2+ chelatase CbiK
LYIDYEKISEKLGFGKDFFYKLKVRQNLAYIKKNRKQVLKKLKNKSPLKVIFYVYDETKWKSQSVYDLMLEDERFNPTIVVTKNCAVKENANFQTTDDVKNAMSILNQRE